MSDDFRIDRDISKENGNDNRRGREGNTKTQKDNSFDRKFLKERK